ncbi:MAG TPA: CoA-binding protein, partial [Methylomirabilota bacterium]|nr:CoA-binding protein [Methylomirabilota bacterium]
MTPAAPEDVGTVAFNGPRGRRCPLQALFAPRRVAVIGATERPGSVGAALMANLDRFPGEVLPVNPRHSRIGGRPAFPSLRAVIGPVDLAV